MGTQEDESVAREKTQDKKKKTPSPNPGKEKEQKTVTVFGKKGGTPDRKPSPASPAPKSTPPPPKGSRRQKCEPTDAKSPRNGKSARGTKVSKVRSSELIDMFQMSSPPRENKEKENAMEKSQMSTFGATFISQNTEHDFKFLENSILQLPSFHGFIGREDLTEMLKAPGDYIIRLSVQANKQELEKRKKNRADVKVLNNLSREKCARREREKEAKLAAVGDVGKREFVISVYCSECLHFNFHFNGKLQETRRSRCPGSQQSLRFGTWSSREMTD